MTALLLRACRCRDLRRVLRASRERAMYNFHYEIDMEADVRCGIPVPLLLSYVSLLEQLAVSGGHVAVEQAAAAARRERLTFNCRVQ